MLLLLDENIPKRLKEDLSGHKVFTIRDKGWNGLKNGLLLQKLIENNFNVLITFDKNMQHQQNFKRYPISVIVLSARINKYSVLKNFVPQVLEILQNPLKPGITEIK